MSRTCSNCFQPLPEGVEICPACGYDSRKNAGKYPLALPEGTVLNGQYILGRVLGQGGFGITYVAQDHRTGALVAVKEYFPDTMATRSQGYTVSAYTGQREENFTYGKECFLNEAKTLAEFIGNPNIVRVYSYFEENNTAYFVMEYVQGTSFQDYLKERGSIPWQEAKWILFPVMEALAAVHAKGIVHRDVTPDNIYITKKGEVKLLDFGAARYSLGDKSRSLDVVLKHGYAPKEQYSRHGRQGPYTDVYALGATFYFAITGRVPPDSIDRQDEDELILPSSLGIKIPVGVEDALCKALAVSAQDRFQSMGDFQLALRNGEKEESGGQAPSNNANVGSVPPPPPPQSPPGGSFQSAQPPQPPRPSQPFVGGRNNGTMWSFKSLSPEKKVMVGVGGLAALFVVVFAVVLANSVLGKGPKVEAPNESSQVSVTSQITSSEVESTQGSEETEAAVELQSSEVELQPLVVRLTEYNDYEISLGYSEYTYDDWGNQILKVDYSSNGSVQAYYQSFYDTKGRCIRKLYFTSDGSVNKDYEYIYDDEALTMVGTVTEEGSDTITKWRCTYDENGNEVKELYYHDDGETVYTDADREYDADGFLVREMEYGYQEDGSESYQVERKYRYDRHGNVIEEQEDFDGDGKADYVNRWEYDASGNMLSESEYYVHSDLTEELYTSYTYEYDEHGQMTSYHYRYLWGDQEDGKTSILETYENEYDSSGNLVKMTAYKNGVLISATEYKTYAVPEEPGGDPNLVPPTPDTVTSANGSVTSQSGNTQPAQSGEFTGSSHGLAGMKFAIVDIKSKKGFVDRYSGFPCGGLVDMEGGPWFLALYELETENSGYAVYYSLYDLRGNGLVVPACEELFVPVGGNNGKVGIYQDGDGTFYLMVEKREADGQTVYTSYSFTPITDDGLSLAGSSFASSEVNSEKGTGVYIVGDSKTDESGLEDFLGKYTPVCSMDLLGNYEGNVITFEDFVQNYT